MIFNKSREKQQWHKRMYMNSHLDNFEIFYHHGFKTTWILQVLEMQWTTSHPEGWTWHDVDICATNSFPEIIWCLLWVQQIYLPFLPTHEMSLTTKLPLLDQGTIRALGLPVVGVNGWVVELAFLSGWHDGVSRTVDSGIGLFPAETALSVNSILGFCWFNMSWRKYLWDVSSATSNNCFISGSCIDYTVPLHQI